MYAKLRFVSESAKDLGRIFRYTQEKLFPFGHRPLVPEKKNKHVRGSKGSIATDGAILSLYWKRYYPYERRDTIAVTIGMGGCLKLNRNSTHRNTKEEDDSSGAGGTIGKTKGINTIKGEQAFAYSPLRIY